MSHYLQPFLQESTEYIFNKLQLEIELWVENLRTTGGPFQESAVNVLKMCDKDIFPIINLSLHLITVMPVSVSSAERSFSALKRLKTYLRSTMSQERLVGLALLHFYREREIDYDAVLNRFASQKKRKLEFIV